jgi:hypothetical protein
MSARPVGLAELLMGGCIHASEAVSAVPSAGDPLQRAVRDFGRAIDTLERLSGRRRAIALDIARRRLARALERQRAILTEHGYEAAA